MRPVPDSIINRDDCTIQIDATEVGMTDATFDGVVNNYGDGEGFSWLAGGGAETYKIHRMERGFEKQEGLPASVWLIEILDSQDTLTHSYIFDSLQHVIREHDGSPVRPEVVNKTINIVLDLFAEEADLRRFQPLRIWSDGVIGPNYWYEPPGGDSQV